MAVDPKLNIALKVTRAKYTNETLKIIILIVINTF